MDTTVLKTSNEHDNSNFVPGDVPNTRIFSDSSTNAPNNNHSPPQIDQVNTITNISNGEIAFIDENTPISSNSKDLGPKWRFYNIVLLGVIFMFIFTAYQTCALVQVLVLEGANIENNNTAGNGYTSLAIVYGSFSVSNWVAAYVVEVLSAKWGMFVGGLIYCVFLAWFLRPHQISLYVTSVLLGFGAAVLWAAQGKFLSINSTDETMSRNTNIFWGLFQSSLIWGNLIIIYKFSHLTIIEKTTRTSLFIILTTVGCVGVLGVMFLKKRKHLLENRELVRELENRELVRELENRELVRELERPNPWKTFKKSLQIMISTDMLLLSVLFLYTGIELSYWSVLVTSVGHMTFFKSESKQLAGLCGLFIGFGQIASSFIFTLASSFKRIDKRLILCCGLLAHIIAFFIVFTTFPSDSPLVETNGFTFFQPREYLVFVSAFLLGFGDSCISTQIYPTLRQLFYDDIASACALFKFLQSLACASSFVYSRYAIMEVQLAILIILLFIGTILFFLLENRRINRITFTQF